MLNIRFSSSFSHSLLCVKDTRNDVNKALIGDDLFTLSTFSLSRSLFLFANLGFLCAFNDKH